MDILNNKHYVYTLATTETANLRHSELLVFSFLWYLRQYERQMSNRAIGRRTGLNEETVASVLHKLESLGMYRDGVAEMPDDKKAWFRCSNGGGFAGFRNYVRSPSGELTVVQHSVFSYALHCKAQQFRPRSGLTPSYIAKVLAVAAETVHKALERLNEYGLIRWDGTTINFYKTLYPDQLMLFLSKDEESTSIAIGEDLDVPPQLALRRLREKSLEVLDPLDQRVARRLRKIWKCDEQEVRDYLPGALRYMRERDLVPSCDPELDAVITRWIDEEENEEDADKDIGPLVEAEPIEDRDEYYGMPEELELIY